jgi:hypothetical protein
VRQIHTKLYKNDSQSLSVLSAALCRRWQPSKPLDLPGSATRTSSRRNKTVHTNQVSRSQSSATFTAHKRRCLCTCCFVSLCWRVTSLTQNADECRMLTSLCQRSQKLAKRMSNLEIFTSSHGLFVQTCLMFEKRGNISNTNVLIQKRVVFGFPK